MFIFKFFGNISSTLTKFFGKRHLSKKRDRYSKSLGFTLIEVLVVMIFVGILSAIAAPSWLSFVSNQRINASQTKLFQAIKTAQSDAKVRKVGQDNRVRLTLRTGQTDDAYQLDNVRTDGGQQSLEAGVTISSITAGAETTPPLPAPPPFNLVSPYTIEFDSRGFIYDPSNTLDYPICINLSIENSTKIRWIGIRTLLGAVVTGSEGTCS